MQLGEATWFAPKEIHNAGHYLAVLVGGSSTQSGAFDVIAAHQPAALSFLAKPSRLPVDVRDGISGVAYVFDAFQNLVSAPTQVSFQLLGVPGAVQMKRRSRALALPGQRWIPQPKRRCRTVCSSSWGHCQHARGTASSGRSLSLKNERSAVGSEAGRGNGAGA